jgi:hypothetical protein
MNQLVIKLTGTINASNFDDWKQDLILQIQSINKELVTDSDFVRASSQVKSFKSAEKALKQAKQSAIEQAEEIQQLFLAIDEVTEEARQARLSLERQIKVRKLEIKEQHVQAGIDEIQKFIDAQIDDLKHIDHSVYLDRRRFESAASGKASTTGLQNSIDQLCKLIKSEVAAKVIEVVSNKAKIDSLPTGYKLLFQDISSLLGFSSNLLDQEIDKRIERYNQEMAGKATESQAREFSDAPKVGTNTESDTPETSELTPVKEFRIVIDILSTNDQAIEIVRAIKTAYGENPCVSEVRLIQASGH